MRIISRNLDLSPAASNPQTIRGATLGNFDGLHLGHKRLIDELLSWANAQPGRSTSLITFSPHPIAILRNAPIPARITTLGMQRRLLAAAGIDRFTIIRFNRALADLSAAEFCESILFERLNIQHLILGADAGFGKGRAGDIPSLQKIFSAAGRSLQVLPLLSNTQGKIGSRAIRESIEAGDLEGTAVNLGRPYQLVGTVVRGVQLGGKIGFPTANLKINKQALPGLGVYACTALLGDRVWPAVANIGVRPTLGKSTGVKVEVHLLDYPDESIYGQRLAINLLARIRAEQKFNSLDELKQQIGRDCITARNLLKEMR